MRCAGFVLFRCDTDWYEDGEWCAFRARLGDLLVSTPPWNAVTHGLSVCLSGRGYGSDSDVIHDDGRKTTIAKTAIYQFLAPSRPLSPPSRLLSFYILYLILCWPEPS